jgi:hypothetical protein
VNPCGDPVVRRYNIDGEKAGERMLPGNRLSSRLA